MVSPIIGEIARIVTSKVGREVIAGAIQFGLEIGKAHSKAKAQARKERIEIMRNAKIRAGRVHIKKRKRR